MPSTRDGGSIRAAFAKSSAPVLSYRTLPCPHLIGVHIFISSFVSRVVLPPSCACFLYLFFFLFVRPLLLNLPPSHSVNRQSCRLSEAATGEFRFVSRWRHIQVTSTPPPPG